MRVYTATWSLVTRHAYSRICGGEREFGDAVFLIINKCLTFELYSGVRTITCVIYFAVPKSVHRPFRKMSLRLRRQEPHSQHSTHGTDIYTGRREALYLVLPLPICFPLSLSLTPLSESVL